MTVAESRAMIEDLAELSGPSGEGAWVGLDVHARSVIGCAIDEGAAEIRTQRVGARTEQIVDWVRAQPDRRSYRVRVSRSTSPSGHVGRGARL